MEELLYPFQHDDIEGAVIRIAEDEVLSINEFLPEVHQLDAGDEYEFAYTCCYIKYRGRHILIDAGFDPDTTPGALESIDVAPEDIALVLLTHADRDHVAGLLMTDGSLTYANAQHVISKEVWEYLSNPETLESLDDERRRFYRRFIRALDGRIQLCEGETEVAEGIHFIPTPGHRVGHAVFQFESKGTPLIHTADSFFHPLFAEHPDWANVTDSVPIGGADSRKKLVAHLAESNALILSSHIPFPGIGQLTKVDDQLYQWSPLKTEV